MDFGYLMDLAKQNKDGSQGQDSKRFMSTQLSKPKKLERPAVQSGAVQRFLAKRDADDRRKQKQASVKKEKLLNLRAQEKGTGRRVSAMLKRNKAANRSVLDDAKDKYNTAATLNGAEQPDADDYGYVSKESEAMYTKLLQQYEKLPDDDYRKSKSHTKERSLDLKATKARVKESLDRQEVEERESKGHRRRKKRDEDSEATADASVAGGKSSSAPSPTPAAAARDDKQRPQTSGTKKRKDKGVMRRGPAPPPPGLDFNAILRLAAEKQHQPVSQTPRPAENRDDGRPMTAKEKEDADLERVRQLRKQGKLPSARYANYNGEQTDKDKSQQKPSSQPESGKGTSSKSGASSSSTKADQQSKSSASSKAASTSGAAGKSTQKSAAVPASPLLEKAFKRKPCDEPAGGSSRKPTAGDTASPSEHLKTSQSGAASRPSASGAGLKRTSKSVPAPSKSAPTPSKSAPTPSKSAPTPSKSAPTPSKSAPTPSKSAPMPSKSASATSKPQRPQSSQQQKRPAGGGQVGPRQFPPADVRRREGERSGPPRRPPQSAASSGRLRIESSDSEYDSEMDDFIDDGPMGGENDYSSAIREIFGYDKSKFQDEDEDVSDMEANFSTVMNEERRSAKLAQMEDDEEFRKEMAHKKRKLAQKSKFW